MISNVNEFHNFQLKIDKKSLLQLWNELCDLIAKNPDKVTALNIEPIIRQGLKRYTDQIGVLWNSLADYFIRGGHFERVCF